MSRSKWKGPYIDKNILKKVKKKNKYIIRVWSRRSVVPSNYINKKALIYNGQIFKPIVITREKVGYKFGEFSTSRQQYGKKNKK
ncbi:MAG: 30S ribosomal protein S19 [Rickettsiales bacterium]|nr:30S ribosomal protein S19 [Rickettsiales bacterium]